ncbi:hypothetical protein RRG08_051671 [Elysia crispata]|uniref:Uncharacterized protein n=1 Tax=Elysia crispata TaxID=231223 RepID=A0AAE1DSN3_9GAST|nr:hypothetical protein RRG08_051671 [Elysia crispata]
MVRFVRPSFQCLRMMINLELTFHDVYRRLEGDLDSLTSDAAANAPWEEVGVPSSTADEDLRIGLRGTLEVALFRACAAPVTSAQLGTLLRGEIRAGMQTRSRVT